MTGQQSLIRPGTATTTARPCLAFVGAWVADAEELVADDPDIPLERKQQYESTSAAGLLAVAGLFGFGEALTLLA